MKVFLSSTVEALKDARLSFIEKIDRIGSGRITLVCYESHAHLHPTLSPEETCLQLARECPVLIVLLDQYYGTPCKSRPGISITHAEVREALELQHTIVPVVRTQTWHEYFVWRVNQGQSVIFAHVKEPRLFEILDDLYSNCNCHVYDNLVSDEALMEIAGALDAVISQGSPGALQHVALPAEPKVISSIRETSLLNRLPRFENGQVLHAEELNELYQGVVGLAAKHGLSMCPSMTWTNGQMLTAHQLNGMLDDIERIYRHVGRETPRWSFGCFQDRQILQASHLNEVGDKLRELSRLAPQEEMPTIS